MGRESPCDLIQRLQGTASIRTRLRHPAQRWPAEVKEGGPALGKRRRMTLNPEGGCTCSPAPRFGQFMQFLRWKAVVAGYHWLVRCLMKDLACPRVFAMSRSTRRVLVMASPFAHLSCHTADVGELSATRQYKRPSA